MAASLDVLPDHVLLQIFDNLDFKNLSTCSRVCRHWYKLTHSKPIKKIDLSSQLFLSPSQLENVLKTRGSTLLELHVVGLLSFNSFHNSLLLLPHGISAIRLFELVTYYAPNLTTLSYHYGTAMGDAEIPASVTRLSLQHCQLTAQELFSEECNVEELVLAFTKYLTSEDMAAVGNACPNLRVLSVEGCSRVNKVGIEELGSSRLKQLTTLDVEGTDINDSLLLFVLRECDCLENLFAAKTAIDLQSDHFPSGFGCQSNIRCLCLKKNQLNLEKIGVLLGSLKSLKKVYLTVPEPLRPALPPPSDVIIYDHFDAGPTCHHLQKF